MDGSTRNGALLQQRVPGRDHSDERQRDPAPKSGSGQGYVSLRRAGIPITRDQAVPPGFTAIPRGRWASIRSSARSSPGKGRMSVLGVGRPLSV